MYLASALTFTSLQAESDAYFRPSMQPDEFLKLLQGPIATIYVGREQVPFPVPMNLTCRQCPLLKEHFDKAIEDQNAPLHLPDEDPKAFAMFVQWLYQEKLPPAEHQDIFDMSDAFMDHLALYYLASRLKTPRLQNETMELLRAVYITLRCSYPIDGIAINQVYQNENNRSALRRFVCDAAAKEFLDHAKGEGEDYEPCLVRLPDFAVQFTEALHDYRTSGTDFIRDCPGRYNVDVEKLE